MEHQTDDTRYTDASSGRHHFLRALGYLISIILAVAVAYAFGYQSGAEQAAAGEAGPPPIPLGEAILTNTDSPKKEVDFSIFWRVWNLLEEKYIDRKDLDANKMVYGAINGMLSATGDPYTTFFDPESNQQFEERISGNFEGIGAEIGMKDSVLTVIAPLDDSPAAKAGLRAGDKILKVDGEDIGQLSVEKAVQKIRGPKGSAVKLTIFREGEEETRDIGIVRDVIQIKNVKVDYKDDSAVGVIRISQFGDTTAKEFAQAADEVMSKKVRALIIDLRSDPGGLLESAVSVASRFLPKGQTVVIEENADGKQDRLLSKGGDTLSGLPIVVLIDGGSASASEILAGALKDNASDRVTLVGEKSFGKGSVQQLLPVTGNTSVKITIAHWLTPNGNQINKQGITPDVEVKMTADDEKDGRDPQLDKALEILQEKIR